MAFSFFGGVHPKENKWYACDKETQVFPEPDIVVIPMSCLLYTSPSPRDA